MAVEGTIRDAGTTGCDGSGVGSVNAEFAEPCRGRQSSGDRGRQRCVRGRHLVPKGSVAPFDCAAMKPGLIPRQAGSLANDGESGPPSPRGAVEGLATVLGHRRRSRNFSCSCLSGHRTHPAEGRIPHCLQPHAACTFFYASELSCTRAGGLHDGCGVDRPRSR